MVDSLGIQKTTCHARSNSLPSRSHPLTSNVEDHLYMLKASKAMSSSSASSICNNLGSLRELHECLNDLIYLPSIQQIHSLERCDKWANEVLEGSLKLLDVCGTARDVLLLMKESVKEVESSLRRKRGGESGLAHEVGAYMISRKKVTKMVSKCIRDLKNCSSALLDMDSDLVAVVSMLREVETISFTVLKSMLFYASGTKAKQSNWSLVSKFMRPKHVSCDVKEEIDAHEIAKIDGALYALTIEKSSKDVNNVAVQNVLKQLQTLELTIQELE